MSPKRKKVLFITTITIFAVYALWWLSIYLRGLTEGVENNIFTSTYSLLALIGGVYGLIIAKRWGGFRSILGRSFGAFAIGLLGQFFGQFCYNYYFLVLNVEVPYPSIGDIGFFATGIFYAYGTIQLMRATGVRFSFGNYKGKVVAIIIPVLWAVFSYIFLLRGFEFDFSNLLITILDLSSPVIDSIYLSLAILIYLLSRKFLGGAMKMPILFLLFAIVAETVSDFTFIYLTVHNPDLFYPGAFSDFMYLVSYTIMALALIQLGSVFNKLNETQ